mmetsp:Transcript_129401/g.374761  ORF Transcript_129401/g.374761 Transcript_129401/m.374761 type:complete len:298 (+) Transcript_129401:803-1696(+)
MRRRQPGGAHQRPSPSPRGHRSEGASPCNSSRAASVEDPRPPPAVASLCRSPSRGLASRIGSPPSGTWTAPAVARADAWTSVPRPWPHRAGRATYQLRAPRTASAAPAACATSGGQEMAPDWRNRRWSATCRCCGERRLERTSSATTGAQGDRAPAPPPAASAASPRTGPPCRGNASSTADWPPQGARCPPCPAATRGSRGGTTTSATSGCSQTPTATTGTCGATASSAVLRAPRETKTANSEATSRWRSAAWLRRPPQRPKAARASSGHIGAPSGGKTRARGPGRRAPWAQHGARA